jgi:hypothetical protein
MVRKIETCSCCSFGHPSFVPFATIVRAGSLKQTLALSAFGYVCVLVVADEWAIKVGVLAFMSSRTLQILYLSLYDVAGIYSPCRQHWPMLEARGGMIGQKSSSQLENPLDFP